MTFLELQDLVLDWLDDPNAGYFTREKVKQWLNNGQLEVQKRLVDAGQNWYLKCVQTTMVANQTHYALPEDFLKTHRIAIVDSVGTANETENALTPITLQEQRFLGQMAAYPQAFYLKKDRLVILPKPDTTYTMRLEYSYRVADMVQDAEEPDCPEQYHELVAIEGALPGFIKDGRDPSALIAKQGSYDKLLKSDAADRIQDTPRMVVTTDEY